MCGGAMDEKAILARVIRCNATTSIANAFRRFFGIMEVWEAPRGAVVVSRDRYEGMAECFANHGSPMDA